MLLESPVLQPHGDFLQKWLVLLLELLIFHVPVHLSHCIFGCLPLFPPAVSLSVSCVFSVLLFQHCFMMPQSLGVIGGKPNSAHYFIGYVGECPEDCKDCPKNLPPAKKRFWVGTALLLGLWCMLQGFAFLLEAWKAAVG